MNFKLIKLLYDKYNSLSKQTRDSIFIAGAIIGSIATIITILGISFVNFGLSNICYGLGIVIIIYIILFLSFIFVSAKSIITR